MGVQGPRPQVGEDVARLLMHEEAGFHRGEASGMRDQAPLRHHLLDVVVVEGQPFVRVESAESFGEIL